MKDVIVRTLPPGTLVFDKARQRTGVVMGHEGPYVQLRPEGGGREWDADPERVAPVEGAS